MRKPCTDAEAAARSENHGPALRSRRAFIAALPLIAAAPALRAQAPAPEPELGTPGKDAGWIPTPTGMVEAMLELAGVTKSDYVVDLGSGDGRIPILAGKLFGSQALGIELNGDLVAYSIQEAKRAGVADRVQFIRGDIFATDYSRATVITLFMTPSVLRRLRPKLLAMKPGTRILSYLFALEEWEPDEWAWSEGMHGMLWVVPASAGGHWQVRTVGASPSSYALRLAQRFQKIDGAVRIGGADRPRWDATLRGERIRFTALEGERRHDFTGTVAGDGMAGLLHVTGEPQRQWIASRA
ncbi:MAG: SAM-dependent methyltransferase [Burkholderiales bacterium]|nr:SAM-dependent methyltransferase [Burkholderiales bacterium]